GVRRDIHALPRGELAPRVLALDGGLGAGVAGLLAQGAEALALVLPAHPRPRTRSYSPHSSRSTPQTSPIVAFARRASRIGGSRLSAQRAAARTASSRLVTSAWSRPARSAASRATWPRSVAGSTRRISGATSSSST